jgi:tetratricopeptide (TPR) repeat protein
MDESIALARECVAQRRALDGPDAATTLNSMLQLGGQLVYAKRLEEAREVLEETLALYRAKQDKEGMVSTLNNLGYCYTELGRTQDALDGLLEAQAIKIAGHGENSVTVSIGYHNIAKALGKLDRMEECLKTHQKAIAISTNLTGGAVRTLVFRGAYGMALLSAQRYEEAEAELLAAYEGIEKNLGTDNVRARTVAAKLAELYAVWGKQDKARRFQAMGS